MLLLPLVAVILICEYKGDRWEQIARKALYSLRGDSIPAYSAEHTDVSGVPYVDYYPLNGITAGKQYNATIVCNYALNYLAMNQKDSFFNCVHWLEKNLTHRAGAAFYDFNWQQPWYDSVGVPFTSGMTSGLAISVFTSAYQLTHQPRYLENIRSLCRGFYLNISKGGFTIDVNNGWWYEEIADTAMHTPMILDGHIYALLGVYRYWEISHDDTARMIFDKGVAALQQYLPAYDAGDGWAYYDKYHKKADKKYQHILMNQMKQLGEITGIPLFITYEQKWRKPFAPLYVIRTIKEGNVSAIAMMVFLFVLFGMMAVLMDQLIWRVLKNKGSRKEPL